MVAGEGGLTNLNLTHLKSQGERMEEKKKVKEVKGVVEPPSNSLTQTDRDYYNMVRTEDGKSGFFLDKKLKNPFSKILSTSSPITSTSSHMLPAFLFTRPWRELAEGRSLGFI